MSVNRWWARVENAVAKAEDERVWLHKELKLTADGRREAADPVMDALLKALRALGEHRFSNVNDYKTASRIKEDINFAGFLQLFRVEQDARPWAQLARTAYLTRLVRRCMLCIEDAYREGGDLNNEWEEELKKAREKRIKRLKVWRQVHGEAEVTALSHEEKRELWVLLSYSLKRSQAVSEQRQHSNLVAMIDGELIEDEIEETNRALGMLAPFVSEELPACFVPSYEVMLIDGTNKASWGDAEVSVLAANYNAKHSEESTTFNEEEMLRRSEVLSDLHHPNIVQFFGMSHVGAVRFEMFEKFVENKYISTKDISTQWDIWRSCALVLHYLLERGMSYDIFSREKVLKAYSQNKFVLLGTGISASQDADLSVIPERYVENMKSFAEMIVEDVGRIYRKFGEGIKVALMSCTESAPPHTLEANIWEILQMFCSSCLSKEPAPSQALFALGEIVRKEGTYDAFKTASRNEVSPLSDTDQPIDQVKAAVECFDYNPEPFEKIMKKLDSKCKRHNMNPNDHLVLHRLHSVYGRLKRAPVPLPQLVIKSFFRALERFFEHIEDGDNDPNVRFMILKALESVGHALNTNGFESFKTLRRWRDAFRKNYTSQLANENEVELINQFERTKRSGYPFDSLSKEESDRKEDTKIESSKSREKITLERWFIPPYEIEVAAPKPYKRAYSMARSGRWFYTEVILKRVFASKSDARKKSVTRPEAFKHEASIWFSLTHPNVIKLYGASNLSASMLFVCEYARNGHLENFVKVKTQPTNIWRLMRETAVALGYLHACGIVHGDLKCNNILVGNNLNVRLEGFGLSTSHSAKVEIGHGVAEYMAPEVKRGLIPNTASDVFSLGVCLAKFDESFCQELDLYKQMTNDDPKRRPSASVVVMRLNQLANRPIVSNPQSNTLGDQKLTLDIIPIDIDESMRHFKEAVTRHPYARVFSSFADKLVDVWSTTGTDDRFRRESLVELVQRTLKMADICKNCTYHTTGDILRAVVMINCVERLYQKLESLDAKMDSSWKLKWEADCKEYVQLVTLEFKNSNDGLGDIRPAAEVNHIAERYIGTLSATVSQHASQLLSEVETFDSFAIGKWFVSVAERNQDADEAGAWWYEGVRVELCKLDDIGDLYPNQFHMMCDLWFKLCHPNILKLVGANALESPFVVCAYIDHISLKDYIRRVDSTCEKLQYILYQVALGLCYLETQRIGCSALSCESIYVDPQGCRAKIDLLFADIFEFEAISLAPSSAECIRALFQEMLSIHSERNDTLEKNHAFSTIQSLLAESSISYIVCNLFNGSSSIDLKAAGTLQDLVRKDDEESLDVGALATKSVADDFPGLDLLHTVIVRLQQVTREAQDLDPAKSIVKTFVHLLAVYTQTSPIVQLGLTRWLVVTVMRMHEHLDDFEANAGLSSPLTQIHRLWKRPVEICRCNLTQKWVEWLDTYRFDDIPDRYPADSQLEALTLLEYEYVTHRAVMTAEEQHLYRSSYAQLSESWQLHIFVLPPWFVPPYDAQDSAMGTDMALVCQQPSCPATAGCYEQLSEEVVVRQASLWSKLHHRNIVRFIGACHVGVDRFMAFDGSEGKQTLRKYIAMAPRNRSEVWRLLKDAANGLSYLHQNHIAHRSLTLDAILVRSELTSSPTTHTLSATEPIQYKQKNVSKLSGTSSHVALLFRVVPESKVGCSKEQLADRYFTEDIAALGRCIVECVAGVQLEASSRVEDLNIDDVAAKMGKGGWHLVEAMLRGKMLDLSRVSREIDFISIHDVPVVVRRRSKQPNSSISINMIEESSMQVRQVDAETMLDRLMNEPKSNQQMITLVSQLRNAWAQSTAVNREPEVKSKIEEIIIKLYQLVVSQPNRSGRSQRSANTLKTRLVIGALQKEFDALAASICDSS